MGQIAVTPSLTRSQEIILKKLEALDTPISAQNLYTLLRENYPRLGLATVYRALDVLKLRGLIQCRTNVSNSESIYSLINRHDQYITCLRCGQSVKIDVFMLSELEAQLEQSQSFQIFYHTLEFFGVCSPCGKIQPLP
jgi:Fur family transcriptional regulator, ferric uptake regulator